ncbi:M24 family metallopeptidase [Fundicoccus culcitae]|uniref:Aminopeptidase P family protein n=1 Tax=Fundicoccus culcitae TaxID=2969821 RepID=A0ABY5P6X7_9LACT|nr:aminopeptidase P family protein [Fundicoccus culcitae]UUX34235.1 aminopeptidase P family protein [Fundicoccus culcitae]
MNKRIEKLRNVFEENNIDAMLVTNSKNLRYLARFTGSAGAALITKNEAFFITDFRYRTQATNQAVGFKIVIHKEGIFKEVQQLLEQHSINRIGIEAQDMIVSSYLDIQKLFKASIVPTQGVIEKIREIKEEDELAIIKEACKITDESFDHILTFIKPGMTEIAVANELERFLKDKGASAMSFDTIIASGVRSAMPHGVASDKVIEEGDIITLDYGCYYKGYSSDMTRTIAVGSIDPKLEEIYHIVLEAHERVNQGAKAGMTGKEVDALARDYITEKGYGDYFGHSTGHGLGLDVHELPAVSFKNENPLQENMVITNEPGIYIEGLGGVRIENDLIVHADSVEQLNHSPKHLIII